ncbi:hypothetical protein [Sphingobium olei]|uniref:Uncharacterized protein n=1 Tax=Sphingobium olei TaxID=420955 RepID=A0ABW3NYF5_9SPHN
MNILPAIMAAIRHVFESIVVMRNSHQQAQGSRCGAKSLIFGRQVPLCFKVFSISQTCKAWAATNVVPVNINAGNNIPSCPGLGVSVIAPTQISPHTQIARNGVKLRAKIRGADQLTKLGSGSDRESRHCIGNLSLSRKRAFAQIDNPIITSAKIVDTISTATITSITFRHHRKHGAGGLQLGVADRQLHPDAKHTASDTAAMA